MNDRLPGLPGRCVPDASALVRAVLPGVGTAAAIRLRLSIASGETLAVVPDFVYAECANAFWKYVRVGELAPDDARSGLRDLQALPLDANKRIRDLAPAALNIALRFETSVYDALYVALADQTRSTLITLDARLQRKVAGSGVAVHLLTDFESTT